MARVYSYVVCPRWEFHFLRRAARLCEEGGLPVRNCFICAKVHTVESIFSFVIDGWNLAMQFVLDGNFIFWFYSFRWYYGTRVKSVPSNASNMVDIIKGILCTCRSPCLSIHPSRKFAESLLKRAPPRITKFISKGEVTFRITKWYQYKDYPFTSKQHFQILGFPRPPLPSCICICIWFICRWCSGKCQLPLYFPELSSIRGGSNSGRKVSNKRLGNSWLENSKCGASTSTGRNKVNTIKQTRHNITEKLATALMVRQDKNNNINSKQSKSKDNKNYFQLAQLCFTYFFKDSSK